MRLLYPTYQVFLTAALALLITAVLTPLWIRILKGKHIGQVIRIDGPQEHLAKEGTPTMGGLLILFTITICFLFMSPLSSLGFVALGTVLIYGFIGFFDDYLSIIKARSLGLNARIKLFWEFIVAAIVGLIVVNFCGISTDIAVPMTKLVVPLGQLSFKVTVGGTILTVPILYLIFVFIILAGTVNSVNLTDGLDGLAAGTVTITLLAYAGIAFKQDRLDLAILCAAAGGACIGFLWYNCYPAEIFMGDTGALGLGAAIATLAILTKTELFLVLIGGIYVIETLSVVGQVFSFRLFGKRILKMAPIHHHFEMLGWSETKVMIRFWIISGALSGAGFALYFMWATKGGLF